MNLIPLRLGRQVDDRYAAALTDRCLIFLRVQLQREVHWQQPADRDRRCSCVGDARGALFRFTWPFFSVRSRSGRQKAARMDAVGDQDRSRLTNAPGDAPWLELPLDWSGLRTSNGVLVQKNLEEWFFLSSKKTEKNGRSYDSSSYFASCICLHKWNRRTEMKRTAVMEKQSLETVRTQMVDTRMLDIWKSKLPLKINFFLWLLHKERIQSTD